MRNIVNTPRLLRVLELAIEQARNEGRKYIGTEHVLLAIAQEGEGVGARVLHNIGVTLERMQQETYNIVGVPKADDRIKKISGLLLEGPPLTSAELAQLLREVFCGQGQL